IRCNAGKSEPGLTTKVPPVICWILRETPNPCFSPAIRDFKISKSKVPCNRVVGSESKLYLLLTLYRNNTGRHIECQYEACYASWREVATSKKRLTHPMAEKRGSRTSPFLNRN